MADDLPILGSTIRTTALVDITEAIGTAPDSERIVTDFSLLSDDEHSNTPYAAKAVLARKSDGSATYSCERWVRLRFSPPFGALVNIRFWVDNYDPADGWDLLWGTSPVYLKPTASASSVAVFQVPSTDPVTSNIGMDLITGGQVQYTPWIVLQARWMGSPPGQIQPSPFNWHFGWSES